MEYKGYGLSIGAFFRLFFKEVYMKIAQIAPLYESVPPKMYGGTERIVSYLTEELVRQGHEVTLFASGDSNTSANLVSCCKKALRLNKNCLDRISPHILQLEMLHKRLAEFDIVHYHSDSLHLPLARRARKSHVTTTHGRMDIAEYKPLFREYEEIPLISISHAQRMPLPRANWLGTVYHGLPNHLYQLHPDEGKYLAFLGRISPEKGLDRAIDIARRAKLPLKVAAKIDAADQDYFDYKIKSLLDDPLVEFVGEIGEKEKNAFLGNAIALLFPINWPEPFGLVMIEAMACGTPVIAYPHGSVPEVIDEGLSGFIVNSPQEAAKAVHNLHLLDRKLCRATFEKRFSAERMAADYLSIYEQQAGSIKFKRVLAKV